MDKQITIGQLAKEVDIPAKTIRYYEDIRLLEPAKRWKNGYRFYVQADVQRLHLIKQAKALSLPLNEIKALVKESMSGSCLHLKERILAHLPAYIQSINQRIINLRVLKQQLKKLRQDLTLLELSDPHKKVSEKDCCEVLDHMKKGGDTP